MVLPIVIVGVLSSCSSPNVSTEKSAYASFDEMVAAHTRCLQDMGWADATSDGNVQDLTVTPEQFDQYRQDDEECRKKVGVKMVPAEIGLSTENLSSLYDLEVETSRCLVKLGYESGDVPSKQVFIDEYQSGTGGWTAYEDLPPLAPEQYQQLSEQCPQASVVHGKDLWQKLYGN